MAGYYREIFNSDSEYYSGTNTGNGCVNSEEKAYMGQQYSLNLTLPPLGAIYP
jgi:1,4-alpha-glucan branching enzyme